MTVTEVRDRANCRVSRQEREDARFSQMKYNLKRLVAQSFPLRRQVKVLETDNAETAEEEETLVS